MARVPAYAPLNQQEAGQNAATSSMPASISSEHWDRAWRRHSENGAPAYFVCFAICAVWSTLVIYYSQDSGQGDAAPAWPYFWAIDWVASFFLYVTCMDAIYTSAGAQDWTPLMETSIAAQLGSAALHFVLFLVYFLGFEGKQYPNMVVVWKAWSAWINVAMAGVMLLRNHGVGWAEGFHGRRAKSVQQKQQASKPVQEV